MTQSNKSVQNISLKAFLVLVQFGRKAVELSDKLPLVSSTFLIFFLCSLQPKMCGAVEENDDQCVKDFLVLDVGSSTTKAVVYKKDICNGNKTLSKKVLNKNYPYQSCVSDAQSEYLPAHCISGGVQTIESMKSNLQLYCTDNCFALVTGWARYINNAGDWQEAVSAVGVKPVIASQNYEGELKLIAMRDKIAAQAFIAFDIGGGSFQLIWSGEDGQIHHHNGLYGTDNFTHEVQDKFFSEEIKSCVRARNKLNILKNSKVKSNDLYHVEQEAKQYCNASHPTTLSLNDLQLAIEYAQKKIAEPILQNHTLQEFLKKHKPIVYADTLLFHVGIKHQLGVNKDVVTIDDIKQIMYSVSDMNHAQIKSIYHKLPDSYVNTTQPAMLILHAIMKGLGVKEIHMMETDYMEAFINAQIER